MYRSKSLRRGLGALLIWLHYDLTSGIALVLAGAALELAGMVRE